MKVVHHAVFNASEEARQEFGAQGIHLNERFSVFDVAESNKNWPAIKKLMKKYEVTTFTWTEFTPKERAAADYIRITGWQHGYPEPSDDGSFRGITYDLDSKHYCAKCRRGKHQKAPFRFARKPKWGAKHILELHWITDEFFVRPEIWKTVFQPLGIDKRPVLNKKGDKELDTVVQLVIPQSGVHLDLDSLTMSYETCPVCKQKKYHRNTGFFPSLQTKVDLPIFKVLDYFGSGGVAGQPVIISAALYQAIEQHKVKGLGYAPLAKA